MKIRIFCVRHGDYLEHSEKQDLTEEGRKQAEVNYQKINEYGPFFPGDTLVLNSPQTRAVQTAQIICKKLHLGLREVDWLDCDTEHSPIVKHIGRILGRERDLGLKNLILVSHEDEIEEILNSYGYDCPVGVGSVHLIELQVSVQLL